ncbi:MAG: hypothetical protein FWE53_02945 [Firmicutes bacterium]|nr:hypothetical protein [Bacillota bacterium]
MRKKQYGLIQAISIIAVSAVFMLLGLPHQTVSADSDNYSVVEKLSQGFNGARHISKYDTSIFVANTLNDVINKLDTATGLQAEFVSPGLDDGFVIRPRAVASLQNGHLYAADNLSRMQMFDSGGNLLEEYKIFYRGAVAENFAQIDTFDVTLNGDVYVFDTLKNLVLLKPHNQTQFSIFCELTPLGFIPSISSKLVVTLDAETIFVSNSSQVLALNSSGAVSAEFSVDTSGFGSIMDMAIDHEDNLYVLHNSIAGLAQISKLTETAGIYSVSDNFDFSAEAVSDGVSLVVDFEAGTGFLLAGESIYMLRAATAGISFFSTFQVGSPPVDLTLPQPVAAACVILSVNVPEAVLLRYPNKYNYAAITTLAADTQLILLTDNVPSAPAFNYVMLTGLNETNVVGYLSKSATAALTDDKAPEIINAITILNNTGIYKYPSALTTDGNELIIGTYSSKQLLTVLTPVCDITDYLGYQFFSFEYMGGIGYIKRTAVRDAGTLVPEPGFLPNAKLTGASVINVYDTSLRANITDTLAADTEVKVVSKAGDMTQIEYLVGEAVHSGWVYTRQVYDGLLSPAQITGIALGGIGLVLIGIFVFFTIKGHRQNKAQNKITLT